MRQIPFSYNIQFCLKQYFHDPLFRHSFMTSSKFPLMPAPAAGCGENVEGQFHAGLSGEIHR